MIKSSPLQVRSPEFRVLGFYPLQLPHQAVILRIGDLRLVEDIIAIIVIFDLFAKFFDPLSYRF
jgi:hypothetical protein